MLVKECNGLNVMYHHQQAFIRSRTCYVWRERKILPYCELSSNSQSIDSETVRNLLNVLIITIQKEQPEIGNRMFVVQQQDNTRTSVCLTTGQRLLQIGKSSPRYIHKLLHLQEFKFSVHYKILLIARTSKISE